MRMICSTALAVTVCIIDHLPHDQISLDGGQNFYWMLFIFADLMQVKDRNVEDLSGGELQRFAIAMVCIQKADM